MPQKHATARRLVTGEILRRSPALIPKFEQALNGGFWVSGPPAYSPA
jgi:hypothetical protein